MHGEEQAGNVFTGYLAGSKGRTCITEDGIDDFAISIIDKSCSPNYFLRRFPPGLNIAELDTPTLCHLILHGNPDLTQIANKMIMEATISYIKATKRFQ